MAKPSSTSLIPVLIIVSIIAGGLYFLFKPQPDIIRQPDRTPPTQQNKNIHHEAQVDTPQKPANDEARNTAQTQYRRAPMEVVVADPCLETIKKLDSFFLYLDSQDYIQGYQFPNGSKEFISSMANIALSHPPQYESEKSIINQVKTGTYLYRTIGAQNLVILSKILINEPDQLETVFENFYSWSFMAGQCPNRTYSIRPQLDQLYQYALFFIDTQDGQRYVTRRDSLTNLLTRYYALKIIKEAQTNHIDKYNIDITPHVLSLITDMESSDLLEKKTTYLKTLYSLRDV